MERIMQYYLVVVVLAIFMAVWFGCVKRMDAHEVNECPGGRKIYAVTNANIELKVYEIDTWFWIYSHSVYTDNESCYELTGMSDNKTYGFIPQVERPWHWEPEYKDNQTKENQ